MAEWRANPALYGPGGGEWVDDNGTVTPDPWGVLNQPNSSPAIPAAVDTPATSRYTQPAQVGGISMPQTQARNSTPIYPPGFSPVPAIDPGGNPNLQPAGPMIGGPPEPVGQSSPQNNKFGGFGASDPTGPALTPSGQPMPPDPAQARGSADKVGPLPPDPTQARGMADAPTQPAAPAFVGVTDSKTSTEGPDQASVARTEAGIGRQQAAQQGADAGMLHQREVERQLTETRSAGLLASSASGLEKIAAQQAVQDHISEEVDRRLNAGGPNSKDQVGIGSVYWRPDRAELFHGDNGVAFGISAAVAAMAGAWMQGRGLTGQNPYLPTIMKLIDDNVSDQVRRNSTAYQHLKDIKGDVKAAKLELKERQLMYVQQQADGIALKDKSTILQAGMAGFKDQLTAEREKTRNDQEKALTRKVTQETSHKMVANPAAKAATLPRSLQQRYVDNNMIQDKWRNARAQIVDGQKSGAAAAVMGTFVTHGVNWVQEHLNGLPPDQKKFVIALNELRVLNHLANNIPGISAEEKEKLGETAIPEKINDIPNTLSHFDELYQMKQKENQQMLQGAGHEEPGGPADEDPIQGSF